MSTHTTKNAAVTFWPAQHHVKHLVIGIDPGPVVGICVLTHEGAQFAQIDYPMVTLMLELLVDHQRVRGTVVHVATEAYVTGSRSARTASAKANKITRDMDAYVQRLAPCEAADGVRPRGSLHRRPASDVKTWATDKRLTAAGLNAPKGMRHAKDGARHALYCAVHDLGVSDPLSKRSVADAAAEWGLGT